MTSLEEIQKAIHHFKNYDKEAGVIILNEKDFDEVGGSLNREIVWEHNTLFGVKLVVVLKDYYDANFLPEGKALVLEKKVWDFLKRAFIDYEVTQK